MTHLVCGSCKLKLEHVQTFLSARVCLTQHPQRHAETIQGIKLSYSVCRSLIPNFIEMGKEMWKLRIEINLPLTYTVAFTAPIFTRPTMDYNIFVYLLCPMSCKPDGIYRKVAQKVLQHSLVLLIIYYMIL